MPLKASEGNALHNLSVLLMGPYKLGKSCTLLTIPRPISKKTGQRKKIYVINCDQPRSLQPVYDRALERGLNPEDVYEWDFVDSWAAMDKATHTFARGVRKGLYCAGFLDTLTSFVARLEMELIDDGWGGEGDYGKMNRELRKRVHGVIDRLSACPAHLIVTSHFSKQSAEIPGQLEKSGDGVVPNLPGALRQSVPAQFQDIVMLEKVLARSKKTGKDAERRMFTTSKDGVWGLGCRSLPGDGTEYRHLLPDFGKMIDTFAKVRAEAIAKGNKTPEGKTPS